MPNCEAILQELVDVILLKSASADGLPLNPSSSPGGRSPTACRSELYVSDSVQSDVGRNPTQVD